jgi:hypothetical protein
MNVRCAMRAVVAALLVAGALSATAGVSAAAPGAAGAIEAPLPAAAPPDAGSFIQHVSCWSATSCVAVGNYRDSANNVYGLIETLSGGKWRATVAPVPANAGTVADGHQFVSLGRVSCPSPGACTAIGAYTDAAGGFYGLIETLAGGKWSATSAPEPADVSTTGSHSTFLQDLSCASATTCTAVGQYNTQSGSTFGIGGLIETLSGGTWTASSAPTPQDAKQTGFPIANLRGVSCASVTDCTAVGVYVDDHGRHRVLFETLSAGAWSPVAGPVPANANRFGWLEFAIDASPISCASPTTCVAVGTYVDLSGHFHGLIDTLSAGTWTATDAPLPAGGTPGSIFPDVFASIACPTTASCIAVGTYEDPSGNPYGLIETLSGGTWTASTAPEPANAGTAVDGHQAAGFYALSCPSATTCTAVGVYVDSTGGAFGLIDTLSDGTWSATSAPEPANAGTNADGHQSASLLAVSCTRATSCISVGSYEDSTGSFRGLLASGPDLSRPNLKNADLSRANLSGANLSHANLTGANLSGADLHGAVLAHTKLHHANATGADLTEADLSHADLHDANLTGAHLAGADLTHADFHDANLTNADLTGATTSHTEFNHAIWSNTTCPDGANSDSFMPHTCIGHGI